MKNQKAKSWLMSIGLFTLTTCLYQCEKAGVSSSNAIYLRGLQDPPGVPNDNTFLGFTTYTHYNVAGL